MAKGGQGVDADSAPGRQGATGEPNYSQSKGNTEVSKRIRWGDADQTAAQRAGHYEGDRNTGGEPTQYLAHSLFEDEVEDVPARAAHRDADADFASAAADGLGDDGVEANRGEEERDGGEQREELAEACDVQE